MNTFDHINSTILITDSTFELSGMNTCGDSMGIWVSAKIDKYGRRIGLPNISKMHMYANKYRDPRDIHNAYDTHYVKPDFLYAHNQNCHQLLIRWEESFEPTNSYTELLVYKDSIILIKQYEQMTIKLVSNCLQQDTISKFVAQIPQMPMGTYEKLGVTDGGSITVLFLGQILICWECIGEPKYWIDHVYSQAIKLLRKGYVVSIESQKLASETVAPRRSGETH